MTNFFIELELFIRNCQNTDTGSIFFEFAGAKVPFDIAIQIYERLSGAEAYIDECAETIEEQRDFIRLLREENKRLREGNENER